MSFDVVVKNNPGIITFENYEKLKMALSEKMKQYQNAVVTEDTKDIAKKEVADLRKLSKSINDRKIEIKKAYMAPYSDWENKAKELISLVDAPVQLIDKQIKELDERKRNEKRDLIKQIWSEEVGDLGEFITLSKAYDTKWENVGTSEKRIRDDMQQKIFNVQVDIDTLKSLEYPEDLYVMAITSYKRGFSIADVIRMTNEAEKAREEAAARSAAEKAAKEALVQEVIASAEEKYEPEEVMEQAPDPEPVWTPPQEDSLPFVTDSTRSVVYSIVASDQELDQLETYMNSVGIVFTRRDA